MPRWRTFGEMVEFAGVTFSGSFAEETVPLLRAILTKYGRDHLRRHHSQVDRFRAAVWILEDCEVKPVPPEVRGAVLDLVCLHPDRFEKLERLVSEGHPLLVELFDQGRVSLYVALRNAEHDLDFQEGLLALRDPEAVGEYRAERNQARGEMN